MSPRFVACGQRLLDGLWMPARLFASACLHMHVVVRVSTGVLQLYHIPSWQTHGMYIHTCVHPYTHTSDTRQHVYIL